MIKWLLFYLSLPFIYALSLLPYRVLYLLSDLLNVVIFKIVGYRKKVVVENMQRAFPEKSDREVLELAKKFYSFFCDIMVESLKLLTIHRSSLEKRVEIKDFSLVEDLKAKEQSALMVFGHYCNWEMMGVRVSIPLGNSLFAIYRPLKDPRFDKVVYKLRTRFDIGMYAVKESMRGMIANRDKTTYTFFLTDQTPPPETGIWLDFLNQDTPVFPGTEKISQKFDYPVVFINTKRIRRGYYSASFEMLVEQPRQTKPGEITEIHTRRLEKQILEDPAYWLWTHRRWKHKRP